jgi:hypothetical protein
LLWQYIYVRLHKIAAAINSLGYLGKCYTYGANNVIQVGLAQ